METYGPEYNDACLKKMSLTAVLNCNFVVRAGGLKTGNMVLRSVEAFTLVRDGILESTPFTIFRKKVNKSRMKIL